MFYYLQPLVVIAVATMATIPMPMAKNVVAKMVSAAKNKQNISIDLKRDLGLAFFCAQKNCADAWLAATSCLRGRSGAPKVSGRRWQVKTTLKKMADNLQKKMQKKLLSRAKIQYGIYRKR